MIVVEGIDNSGKSTLAAVIARVCGLNIQESEGPPKSEDEINDRAIKYLVPRFAESHVFVRHPVVSQPIYGTLRSNPARIYPFVANAFYLQKPFIVYCDPGDRHLQGHVVKDHDNPAHLAAVEEQYQKLLALYRAWAISHAHVVYRIGDDMERVARQCLLGTRV